MTDAPLQGGCRFCGQVIDPLLCSRNIIEEVAREHRITMTDIHSRNRHAYIVAARACAIRRIREETGLTLAAIGDLFGLDHSTIIHHLNGGNGTGERAAELSRQAQG